MGLIANGQRSKVGRDSLLQTVRPLLSVRFWEEVSQFREVLAAIWFNAVTTEGTVPASLPGQGPSKDETSGLLSLRHGRAGPCELSNQGSRRLRTCERL